MTSDASNNYLALIGRILPESNEGRLKIQIAANIILEIKKDSISSAEELIDPDTGIAVTKITLLPGEDKNLLFLPDESFSSATTILPYALKGEKDEVLKPLSELVAGGFVSLSYSPENLHRNLESRTKTDCTGTRDSTCYNPILGLVVDDNTTYHDLNDD